jgi:hypothetical protein
MASVNALNLSLARITLTLKPYANSSQCPPRFLLKRSSKPRKLQHPFLADTEAAIPLNLYQSKYPEEVLEAEALEKVERVYRHG